MLDLGTLGGLFSIGYGINVRGWVVGESETSTQGGDRHAFVHDGASMRDLNDLLDASGAGWLLQEARDIDDAGHIVANATRSGAIHAVLLTPVPR